MYSNNKPKLVYYFIERLSKTIVSLSRPVSLLEFIAALMLTHILNTNVSFYFLLMWILVTLFPFYYTNYSRNEDYLDNIITRYENVYKKLLQTFINRIILIFIRKKRLRPHTIRWDLVKFDLPDPLRWTNDCVV